MLSCGQRSPMPGKTLPVSDCRTLGSPNYGAEPGAFAWRGEHHAVVGAEVRLLAASRHPRKCRSVDIHLPPGSRERRASLRTSGEPPARSRAWWCRPRSGELHAGRGQRITQWFVFACERKPQIVCKGKVRCIVTGQPVPPGERQHLVHRMLIRVFDDGKAR